MHCDKALVRCLEKYSIWDDLPKETRPIFLYGTGNGADKILDACRKYGILVEGVFASDGFVRNREFRGYHVMAYQEVIDKYGYDVIILLAFGTVREDTSEFIKELDRRHRLIIPDVPLYGGEIFDWDYFSDRLSELVLVSSMFDDEYSFELFCDCINFRLTGKLCYLNRCQPYVESIGEIMLGLGIETVIDGGAFNGDSAAMIMAALPETMKIIAIEPDIKTFGKLQKFAFESEGVCKIYPINCALSSGKGQIQYVSSASRGSGMDGRNRRARITDVQTDSIDNIAADERIDLIKLDVEGSEAEALDGACNVIMRDRPVLSVSIYHRTGDFIDIVRKISSMCLGYHLYIRRPPCIPMWDLTLYAVPEKRTGQY